MKYPEKLFVVGKTESKWTYDPVFKNWGPKEDPCPLGFLNAYEPDKKTFDKKKQTQMDWAYSSYKEINRKIICVRNEWAYNKTIETEAEFQPVIWSNIPLDNFKLLKVVMRAKGNKLWRVLDPRGVQFEIKSQCLEEILSVTGIVKNDLLGKFIWASNGVLKFVGE